MYSLPRQGRFLLRFQYSWFLCLRESIDSFDNEFHLPGSIQRPALTAFLLVPQVEGHGQQCSQEWL